MDTKNIIITEFNKDREWLVSRINGEFVEFGGYTKQQHLSATMNIMVSEWGCNRYTELTNESDDALFELIEESIKKAQQNLENPRAAEAFEAAQKEIRNRQNRGDFSALGASAFNAEFNRQMGM